MNTPKLLLLLAATSATLIVFTHSAVAQQWPSHQQQQQQRISIPHNKYKGLKIDPGNNDDLPGQFVKKHKNKLQRHTRNARNAGQEETRTSNINNSRKTPRTRNHTQTRSLTRKNSAPPIGSNVND